MMTRYTGHLLYCSYGYTPHDFRFIEAACGGGWKVSVIRFDGGCSQMESRELPNGASRVSWLGDIEPFSESNFHRFVSTFAVVCQQITPSLIQAGPLHNVARIVVSAEPKAPILSTSWGFDLLVKANRSDRISYSVTSVLQDSNAVLVDCATLQSLVVQRGTNPSKVEVLPWGVDLAKFSYARNRIDSRLISVLSLRSLEHLYEVEVLLDAMSNFASDTRGAQIKAVIAGDGSLSSALRVRANDRGLGDSVDWRGRVPEDKLPQVLAESSLYVSTSPIDGTSVSLLQAMATGKTCVVTDIESNREWIEDGVSGLLFNPSDSRSLMEALIKAVDDPEGSVELGIAARRKVEVAANWSQRSLQYQNLLLRTANEFR